MTLDICGDPDCPNARRVRELEEELRRLRLRMENIVRGNEPPRGKCGIRYHHKDCDCRGEGGDR